MKIVKYITIGKPGFWLLHIVAITLILFLGAKIRF